MIQVQVHSTKTFWEEKRSGAELQNIDLNLCHQTLLSCGFIHVIRNFYLTCSDGAINDCEHFSVCGVMLTVVGSEFKVTSHDMDNPD